MPYENLSSENDYQLRERWLAELKELPGDKELSAHYVSLKKNHKVRFDGERAWTEEITVRQLIRDLEDELKIIAEFNKREAEGAEQEELEEITSQRSKTTTSWEVLES